MPRAPWHRRSIDSPRPAGRRWTGRLRRSGTLARQALTFPVTVRRRRRAASENGPYLVTVERVREESPQTRMARRLVGSVSVETLPASVVPVSPAPAGAAARPATPVEGEAVPHTIPLLPGEQTMSRRFKFALANACTIASLMLGMGAIFLSMHGDVRWAAVALIGCVIFDGVDGALARKLGVASPFGAQMDSLADMCSFGMAAPVVVFASMHGRAPVVAVAIACGMIAAGAAIRLARFNVSPKDGRFFCGVPTTLTAAVLGVSVLIGLNLPGPVAVAAIAVLAVAMVSGFPYAKLARVAKLPPWFWLAPLAGAVLDAKLTFAILVGVYLISGPLLWLRQRRHPVATA